METEGSRGGTLLLGPAGGAGGGALPGQQWGLKPPGSGRHLVWATGAGRTEQSSQRLGAGDTGPRRSFWGAGGGESALAWGASAWEAEGLLGGRRGWSLHGQGEPGSCKHGVGWRNHGRGGEAPGEGGQSGQMGPGACHTDCKGGRGKGGSQPSPAPPSAGCVHTQGQSRPC